MVAKCINEHLAVNVVKLCMDEMAFFVKTYRGENCFRIIFILVTKNFFLTLSNIAFFIWQNIPEYTHVHAYMPWLRWWLLLAIQSVSDILVSLKFQRTPGLYFVLQKWKALEVQTVYIGRVDFSGSAVRIFFPWNEFIPTT